MSETNWSKQGTILQSILSPDTRPYFQRLCYNRLIFNALIKVVQKTKGQLGMTDSTTCFPSAAKLEFHRVYQIEPRRREHEHYMPKSKTEIEAEKGSNPA